MKKFVVALFAALSISAVAAPAMAQNLVELQVLARPRPALCLDGYLAGQFPDSPYGLAGAFAVMDTWAEAYAGPTWAPAPWGGVMAGVGVEQWAGVLVPRFAALGWVSAGKLSASLLVEANPHVSDDFLAASFYSFTGLYQAGESVKLGLKSQMALGTGPLVMVKVPGTPLSAYAAWTPALIETMTASPSNYLLGIKTDI